MACGWLLEVAFAKLDWQRVDVYRLAFCAYGCLGLLKSALALMLSPVVEMESSKPLASDQEQARLLQDSAAPQTPAKKSLLPNLSGRGMRTVLTLCFLFALDSFASGLVPLQVESSPKDLFHAYCRSLWIMYYFKSRFGLQEGRLGSVFFTTAIIAAGSTLVAASLPKRLGNMPTMVFTHIPSAVFLALIPIPSSLQGSLTFLILRSCIQSMNVAPRSAFLAAILRPEERTMSMGLIHVVKTTATSVGPSITGVLADKGMFWVSFLAAGSLKVIHDLGLLALFKNHERQDGDRRRPDEGEDEAAG